MRFSQNTFTDLAIRMIGFGVLIGIVFPFFMILLGVPRSTALGPWFVLSCVLAGIVVGFVNIVLSRVTVRRKLRILTSKMNMVKSSIVLVSESGNISGCSPETCSIPVESEDEFGQSSKAFNELIGSFYNSLSMLDEIKNYAVVLSSQLDLPALSEYALDMAIKSTSANAGAIFIEQEGEIRLLNSAGIRDADTLIEDQNLLSVFANGESCLIRHPEKIIVESTLTKFHPAMVRLEPIKFKNIPIAVILIAKSEPFQEESLKHISIFSLSLAIALNNALEHEQLQRLAALDPLTGIFNRRFGMIRLHEEFARAARKELPLGVLMFDIDHFKKVNDTYGHMAGDRVLKSITSQIRQGMREGDILVRFGGEEFMLVLPGASKEDSRQIAERIRHIVKDSETGYGDNRIRVTISIGCDSYPESPVDEEQRMIGNADAALYRAKNSGRDKVMVHSE